MKDEYGSSVTVEELERIVTESRVGIWAKISHRPQDASGERLTIDGYRVSSFKDFC